MITWRAAAYLLLTGLVYTVLAFFNIDLLFILLIVLLILPGLSAVQLLIAKGSLEAAQSLDPPVTERGDPVRLVVRLRQNSRLSHGQINVVVKTPEGKRGAGFRRKELALGGGSAADVSFPMIIKHRGLYPAGLSHMKSRDLFGLFCLPMLNKQTCERMILQLTVVPKPSEVPGLEAILSRLSGDQSRQAIKTGDDVDEIANLRERLPGESMRKVHWKLSARLDEIMIKEFENPVRREGLVVLDMALPSADDGKNAENLDLGDFFTDHASFVLKNLIEHQIGTRVITYQDDGRLMMNAGHPDDDQTLKIMLAGMKWTTRWPPAQILLEETKTPGLFWFVMLLATRLDESTARELVQVQARGMSAFLILLEDDSSDDADASLGLLEAGGVTTIRLYRKTGDQHA